MKKTIAALVVLLFTTGCATMAPLSPSQRRAMQSRTFEETSYESVFRSFKTILQDDGYIIKNQDLSGGLIVATIEKTDNSGLFLANFGSSPNRSNYRTGEGYEVSINLEKLNEKTIESRLTIQKVESYSQGGKNGYEILDPQLYKNFYEKVRVELERRKAQGKS